MLVSMLEIDQRELRKLLKASNGKAPLRALRKAGGTALRDMRAEASKRVRQRKRIRAQIVRKALSLSRPKGSDIAQLEWGLRVSGKAVPLVAYPHRQTRRGMSVAVNRGKRTLIPGAFLASMPSGHRGVFVRRGMKRLPIDQQFGSRVTDALLHVGEVEGVQRRGQETLIRTFRRLLPLELEKER